MSYRFYWKQVSDTEEELVKAKTTPSDILKALEHCHLDYDKAKTYEAQDSIANSIRGYEMDLEEAKNDNSGEEYTGERRPYIKNRPIPAYPDTKGVKYSEADCPF